jgi:hypothetical protein
MSVGSGNTAIPVAGLSLIVKTPIVAHHLLSRSGEQPSTIDLIGDGFTLLAGPCDPHRARFACSIPHRAPIDVHSVDAVTADARDLPLTGALVTRPDGREVQRWRDAESAATHGFDWCYLA